MKRIIILFLLLLAAGCNTQNTPKPPDPGQEAQKEEPKAVKKFEPISDANTRVTKKPFGIYIEPKTSPVQPERFKGYHTGTDFETTPEEKGKDILVYSICDGKIIRAGRVSGYGGVVVQSCNLNGEDVTVLYGHVKLSSVDLKVGSTVVAGQQMALLGEQGYETDNERKHLHLSIHKGKGVELKGYVQSKNDLDNWIDYQSLK